MIFTITTVRDIAVYIANFRGDLPTDAQARAVEALRTADHPAWGDDWTDWLDTTGAAIVDAAALSGLYVVTVGGDDVYYASAAEADDAYETSRRQGLPVMLHLDGDCIAADNGHTATIDHAAADAFRRCIEVAS